MTITGRSLWAITSGLRIVEADGVDFAARLPVPTDVPPPLATTNSGTITVATNGQTVFTLGSVPDAGAILAILLDGKVYFPPDFSVVGDLLTWNGATLSSGATFELLGFAGDAAAGHMRLERIVITTLGQTSLVLDGTPLGPHTILYHNGNAFPGIEGHFETHVNILDWLNMLVALNPGDEVYVFYARTLEAAQAMRTETFQIAPSSSRVIHLAEAPTPADNTVTFVDDTRYLYQQDFTIAGQGLTLAVGVPIKNNTRVTVQYTRQAALVLIPGSGDGGTSGGSTPPPPSLPATFFIRGNATIGADNTISFSISNTPAVASKSIAALRGLIYVEGKGYTRTGAAISWTDPLALEATDTFDLFGFADQTIADAIAIREITGFTAGSPVFDLTEAAIAPAKSLVIVSAGTGYGGLVYGGTELSVVDAQHLAWAGPMPIKATDKVIALYFKDLAVANAMHFEEHTVTLGEDGNAFTSQLGTLPSEGANVFVFFNGTLLSASGFSLVGRSFSYLLGTVTENDRFIWLYH